MGGITTSLVVGCGCADLETVPGGDRGVVELEQPQSQPAALECCVRKLSMERRVAEIRAARVPARAVEREERVQVTLERCAICEPKSDTPIEFELALPSPQLLSEVCATRGQVSVPSALGHAEDWTRLAAP
jgi:hypothetical protein